MKIGNWLTHPAADLMPMLDGDEFRALCKSIIERGLEEPILLFDGLVLDGRNRLRACVEVNKEPRFEFWEGTDPYEYVWAHNAVRRHLEPGQRAAIRLKFDEALRHLAEQRREEAAERRRKQPRTKAGAFEPSGQTVAPTVGKAKNELAKRADVSPFTAQKAITVQKEAPELFEQVASGETSLSAAYRQVKRDEALEQMKGEPQPLPDGRFRVIVADPPWPYDVRGDDASHRGAIPYHDMSITDICSMPVELRAHQDGCVLFLWTTNAFLADAPQVVRAWGFEWKTVLTWKKPRMGTGNWLRNITEHCVIAVRGRPVVSEASKMRTTFLEAPNPTGQHSDKPEEFYELVEALCPGSKLELFAREARPGWTVWGSEVDGIVARDGVAQWSEPTPIQDGDLGVMQGKLVRFGPSGTSDGMLLNGLEPHVELDQVEPVVEDLPYLDGDDDWGAPAGQVTQGKKKPDTRPPTVQRTEQIAKEMRAKGAAKGEDGIGWALSVEAKNEAARRRDRKARRRRV